jgi:hypothetical protein
VLEALLKARLGCLLLVLQTGQRSA